MLQTKILILVPILVLRYVGKLWINMNVQCILSLVRMSPRCCLSVATTQSAIIASLKVGYFKATLVTMVTDLPSGVVVG